eukprot:CAMPEP_0170496022 /NCGR_PEP_ID=MMETSP0208-20121228/19627_1 /TAXON_ID=197538 /ORGANISM="Strombidium inclinatum, Strain S3" /LENGTH=80 /DNA_ID=CAMNT_0010772445 /DNA_START=484 /DNA_END=726 /DNA_ORIENTATION=-
MSEIVNAAQGSFPFLVEVLTQRSVKDFDELGREVFSMAKLSYSLREQSALHFVVKFQALLLEPVHDNPIFRGSVQSVLSR